MTPKLLLPSLWEPILKPSYKHNKNKMEKSYTIKKKRRDIGLFWGSILWVLLVHLCATFINYTFGINSAYIPHSFFLFYFPELTKKLITHYSNLLLLYNLHKNIFQIIVFCCSIYVYVRGVNIGLIVSIKSVEIFKASSCL